MGFLLPITPPAISMARLEITSFAFMFVCVPLPVCQMRSGKCSSSFPAITSSAACTIKLRFFGRKLSEVLIHQRGGLLQDSEGADQFGRHHVAANIEMNQRAGGLRAVVAVVGNFDFPHAVRFNSSMRAGHERRFGVHVVSLPKLHPKRGNHGNRLSN